MYFINIIEYLPSVEYILCVEKDNSNLLDNYLAKKIDLTSNRLDKSELQ